MNEKTAQAEYWDNEWRKRNPEGAYLPAFNHKKARKVLSELWRRPHYFPLEKLEIGCGPAIHAFEMTNYCRSWGDTWTGLDISEEAVEIAKANGLNAHCTDIMRFEANGKRFQVFLLLDVLEHLEDSDGTAGKILELSKTPYYVFINVPLYVNSHGDGSEKLMDIVAVQRFLNLCGCKKMQEHIYGCYGLPYMWVEGVCLA